MRERTIYLDHAATTRTDPKVLEAMLPFLNEKYGNPSSSYGLARESRQAVEKARSQVAKVIGAKADQIFFTSGGTESDNWALKAGMGRQKPEKNHLITTAIEHHAILHTCAYLEKQGYEVTYLPVDEQGKISLKPLKQAIRPQTAMISVMLANNEIGTIQPIQEIGQLAREYGILFHTDAVQGFGQVPIDVNAMHIDLLSASSHKCYGPKGVGCLYVGEEKMLDSFLHGGAQERKHRAGTENVAGIVGFGMASEICRQKMLQRGILEEKLRNYFVKRILFEVPYTRLNGSPRDRLPNNVNFSFQFVEGENLLVLLDMDGICGSAGSACTTGQTEPSHVLKAIGLPDGLANGSLRFTLGAHTTKEEIDYTIERIKLHVQQLREQSDGYAAFKSYGR